MKALGKTARLAVLAAFCLAAFAPMSVSARELDSSIAACLKAWGDHPFGKNPEFKTLGTSIKVLGIGSEPDDTLPTKHPSLVLVEPSINLLGGSTIDLMNPNGWYCMRTTISIAGNVNIRANCNAHLATTSDGITVLGNNLENSSLKNLDVTVMGKVAVERPCN